MRFLTLPPLRGTLGRRTTEDAGVRKEERAWKRRIVQQREALFRRRRRCVKAGLTRPLSVCLLGWTAVCAPFPGRGARREGDNIRSAKVAGITKQVCAMHVLA